MASGAVTQAERPIFLLGSFRRSPVDRKCAAYFSGRLRSGHPVLGVIGRFCLSFLEPCRETIGGRRQPRSASGFASGRCLFHGVPQEFEEDGDRIRHGLLARVGPTHEVRWAACDRRHTTNRLRTSSRIRYAIKGSLDRTSIAVLKKGDPPWANTMRRSPNETPPLTNRELEKGGHALARRGTVPGSESVPFLLENRKTVEIGLASRRLDKYTNVQLTISVGNTPDKSQKIKEGKGHNHGKPRA
jgi:hypothetical protein